jgi:hypothetical protein
VGFPSMFKSRLDNERRMRSRKSIKVVRWKLDLEKMPGLSPRSSLQWYSRMNVKKWKERYKGRGSASGRGFRGVYNDKLLG